MQRIACTDPSGVLDRLRDEINKQLPLKNLHWSPGDRPLRTIPSLEIEFVVNDPQKTQHQILGLSDNPLVHIYLLEADSYEAFKAVRKQILDWSRQIHAIRDPMEYVIVQVVDTGKHKSKSVWTKLVSDHGDHAAQIYMDTANELETTEMWAKFCYVLKQQVLYAFSERVHAFETEIRSLQSTRDIVGWNFGRLFVVKESLATCFETMDFLDDAYQIYLEIERMTEPDFFSPTAKILDLGVRPSRTEILELMLTQNCSIFNFNLYLFEREIDLLVALAKTSPTPSVRDKHLGLAVQRGIFWIPKLTHMLELAHFSPYDILKWQMTTSSTVYEVIVANSSNTVVDSRGQLLLLQRDALISLAAAAGFSIAGISTNIVLCDTKPDYPESMQQYESDLLDITTSAIKVFESAQMSRSAAALKVQLATIDYHKGEYQKAFDALEDLPQFYSNSKWFDIATEIYQIYLDCAEKLGNVGKVVEISWSLLKLQPHITETLSTKCIKNIKESSHVAIEELEADIWLNISVIPYLNGDSRYYLVVELTQKYNLPMLQFEKAILEGKLTDSYGNTHSIVFQCPGPVVGRPTAPKSQCKFYTNTLVEGRVELLSLRLYCSSQILAKRLSNLSVNMFQISTCVNAVLDLAKTFTSTKRNLELTIASPRPISAKVKILAVDGLQILYEKLQSSGLDNFTRATLSVPALVRLQQPLARVKVTVEYEKGGCIEFIKQIDLSLAVLVHAQEFFRQNVILDQFLISCTTTMPVIVESASLSGSRRFDVIESQRSTADESHIVLNGAPVSLLYMLEPSSNLAGTTDLIFKLTYRPVKLECESLVWDAVHAKLPYDLQKYSLLLQAALADIVIGGVSYIVHGQFKVDPTDIDQIFEGPLTLIEPNARSQLRTLVCECLSVELDKADHDFSSLNSYLEVAAPEPEVDIVHFVNLKFDQTKRYKVGEPIVAKLEIKTESKWASKPLPKDTKFFYELDKFNCDGWMFSGPCRAEFDKDFSTEITIIPNKSGSLDMVSVEIYSDSQLNQEIVQRQKGETVTVLPDINQLTLAF